MGSLFRKFVDAFVDFTATGGQFVPYPQSPPTVNQELSDVPTYVSRPERIIAIGDLHGDIDKTRDALRLAGVLGPGDHWTGGKTMVVQVGDQLDRGDDEIKVSYLEALPAKKDMILFSLFSYCVNLSNGMYIHIIL